MNASNEKRTRNPDFEELLAFYRGEIPDPERRHELDEVLHSDVKLKAHYDSLEFLDLERAAAIQDSKDLKALLGAAEVRSGFCRAVAQTRGGVFLTKIDAPGQTDAAAQRRKKAWNRHADECVYCRRMRRMMIALRQRQETGITEEPLLRDQLLEHYYLETIQQLTTRIGEHPPVEEPAADTSGLAFFLTNTGIIAVRLDEEGQAVEATAWNRERPRLVPTNGEVVPRGGPPPDLSLTRELPDDLGFVKIGLTTSAEPGYLRLKVEITPGESGKPCKLKVEFPGTAAIEVERGMPHITRIELSKIIQGKPIRLHVRLTEGGEPWEDSFELGSVPEEE